MAGPRDSFISRPREGDATVIRQAARNKTRRGLLPGNVSPAQIAFLRPPGTQEPGLVQGVKQTARLVDKFVGAENMARGAAWTATHPIDRIRGRGMAANQQLVWAGPIKGGGLTMSALKPSWEVPTGHPDWNVIMHKPGEEIVSLAGQDRWNPIPRNQRLTKARDDLQQVRQRLRSIQDPMHASQFDPEEIAAHVQLGKQAEREALQHLATAVRNRHNKPLPMAFSAVRKGTRDPQASVVMQVYPDTTYVPEMATLTETSLGRSTRVPYREPEQVPSNVLMQLFQNPLGPEKPVESDIVHRGLFDMFTRLAQRRGIDTSGTKYVGSEPPRTMLQRRAARGVTRPGLQVEQPPFGPWQPPDLAPNLSRLDRLRARVGRNPAPEAPGAIDLDELRRNVELLNEQIRRNRGG